MPLSATVTLVIDGLAAVLVNPFGPDHKYVAPAVVEFAVSVNVPPLHKGALLVTVGVAGGVGSFKVTDANGAEGQPFNTTKIFE